MNEGQQCTNYPDQRASDVTVRLLLSEVRILKIRQAEQEAAFRRARQNDARIYKLQRRKWCAQVDQLEKDVRILRGNMGRAVVGFAVAVSWFGGYLVLFGDRIKELFVK